MLLAYHNDSQLKADLVEEIQKHRAADSIVQGFGYGQMNGKFHGCAIGCSIHSLNLRRGLNLKYDDHSAYETHLGIPRVIAKLEDSIFEGLPRDRAIMWPEQVAAAIAPGADLSMVWPRLGLWILTDAGLLKLTNRNRSAIECVAALYKRWVDGEKPAVEEWRAARNAAAAAADADADAAAYAADAAAYAAYAADAAAYAAYAADAAAAAAYAAARRSSIWTEARKSAWSKIADKLIDLLSAAEPIANVEGTVGR